MARYRPTLTLSPNDLFKLCELYEQLFLGTPTKLVLSEKVTNIEAFTRWLTTIPVRSIPKLSMPISQCQLDNPAFLALLKTLRQKVLELLEFIILDDPNTPLDEHALEKKLITDIVPLVDFPIQIKNKRLVDFECAMIQMLQSTPKSPVGTDNLSVLDMASVPLNDKKIRLKALMNTVAHETFKQFITIDVEHVEAVEQTINVDESIQLEDVVQHITCYDGELIDYHTFNSDTYNVIALTNFGAAPLNDAYELIQTELFANLPQSIKYLSPIAARKLAENLPHWAAMNKDNCAPFVLRKTVAQEFVLDYEDDETDATKLFSLHTFSPYDDISPYYDVSIQLAKLKTANLFDWNINNLTVLSNLWIFHGDEGIIKFYNQLNQLDAKHTGLSHFLINNYLSHFAHWEPFYNNTFFRELNRLDDYTVLQMACLKRFLVNTGCSQHNLSKTLDEFDGFWQKFNLLCKNDIHLLWALDTNWSTPKGGLPAIYMQRLLTILERARHLADQLKSLDGIVLNQYGAYYASRYEGFTEVHPAMGFKYSSNAPFNHQPFNANFNLYRVAIETLEYEAKKSRAMIICNSSNLWVIQTFDKKKLTTPLASISDKISLADYLNQDDDLPASYHLYLFHEDRIIPRYYENDDTLPMTVKAFDKLTYRYVGQQIAGSTVQSFHINLTSLKQSFFESFNFNDMGGFRLCLLQTLLFFTSDRYQEWVTIKTDNSNKLNVCSTFKALMEHTHKGGFYEIDEVSATIQRLKQLQVNHVNFSSQEVLFYQSLQKISTLDYLPFEKRKQFFFNRVAGLPENFESRKVFYEKNCRIEHTEEDAWVHWTTNAQNNFRARLHQRLLTNKLAAFKFINLVGAYHVKQNHAFLYALNTEEFFAEIPEIKQTYHDELLAFSAQLVNETLNLIPSDFDNVMKTLDEDVVQLKKIRKYLYQSTQGDLLNNYLHYTIMRLVDANSLFTYELVLQVFSEVSQLPSTEQLDTNAVHAILKNYNIPVLIKLSQIINRDDYFVKNSLITMLILLELGLPPITDETLLKQYQEKSTNLSEDLSSLTIPILQERFISVLPTCNRLVQAAIDVSLKTLLKTILHQEISQLFSTSYDKCPKLTEFWIEAIKRLKNFQVLNDFITVDKIADQVKPLALVFNSIIKNPLVIDQEKDLIMLLSSIDFSQLDSEIILYWFDFLSEMPERNYYSLLIAMVNSLSCLYQKDAFKILIQSLKKLNINQLSTLAMIGFCQRFAETPTTIETQYDAFINQLIMHFSQNNQDPIVALCLTEPGFSLPQVATISHDTNRFNCHREPLANLYKHLQKQNRLAKFLQLITDDTTKPMILNILALAYLNRRPNEPECDVLDVAQQLQVLDLAQLIELNKHYDTTLTSMNCLSNALKTLTPEQPFSTFLEVIEKSPFGMRDIDAQFDIQAVERVVNGSLNMLDNLPYPYKYRQQLMETFLLINELGHRLPIYANKPANELCNADIKELFKTLKDNTHKYSKTQQKIVALTIMREAMYRATGQFPFSTQMISLIDCMLHQGDVIANIDTGQGKSLIDVMKAAFLYLESDRVDITTSTLLDAMRDIENYSPFLSLLDIPFAKKPITAVTPLAQFCLNGINFSTFSQLALRFSKALVADDRINPPSGRVSLVLNESDYALLDDRTIKRLASPPVVNLTKKHPWIYEAINTFVGQNWFKKNDTSVCEDTHRLRRYLINQARIRSKSAIFIKELENDTLITWMESAIIVNYKLRENFDYVVLPIAEKTGQFFARILMSDDRPNFESVFGKGIQQLLHAHLNQDPRFKTKTDEVAFEITPENHTIISIDNRTLVNSYRAKKGFIWGSSGTVGSHLEVQEQAHKYGFAFSKIEPHQKNQVTEKAIMVLKGREAHYQHLVQALKQKRQTLPLVPLLIFCENIEKAKDLYAYMKKELGETLIQLNISLDEAKAEKMLINNAAMPNMCTITTAAIGRNTDIPYDKTVGLDIWFTSVAPTRLDMQKKGRTGRQGSPGNISYFFNEEDQSISTQKDIKVLRETLDAAGEKERNYQESLYNTIGFFLAQLEKMPSAVFTHISKRQFICHQWAVYSDQLEQRYRELVLNNNFDHLEFFAEAEKQFTSLMKKAIPTYQPELLVQDKSLSQMNVFAQPYTKSVSLSSCTPAVDIAYHLFYQQRPLSAKKGLTEIQKNPIIHELQQMFATTDYQAIDHRRFFNTILDNKASCEDLKHIYQNFLHEFLSPKPTNFFTRKLGFNTPLNDIADNNHYLVLFRALASVNLDNPITDVDEIKRIATSMIEEYLQNSWWIGHEKRKAAIQLQTEIRALTQIDNVIKVICNSQLAIAEKDIKSNKNYFGNSRLQNTLSNILTMAAALGVQTNTVEENLIPKLFNQLNQLTVKTSELVLTLDSVKKTIESTTGNTKVLATSLSKALQLSEPKKHSLPGMVGRHGLKI